MLTGITGKLAGMQNATSQILDKYGERGYSLAPIGFERLLKTLFLNRVQEYSTGLGIERDSLREACELFWTSFEKEVLPFLFSEAPVFCHADTNQGNIFIPRIDALKSQKEVYLIDFERVALGGPELDISCFALRFIGNCFWYNSAPSHNIKTVHDLRGLDEDSLDKRTAAERQIVECFASFSVAKLSLPRYYAGVSFYGLLGIGHELHAQKHHNYERDHDVPYEVRLCRYLSHIETALGYLGAGDTLEHLHNIERLSSIGTLNGGRRITVQSLPSELLTIPAQLCYSIPSLAV